MAACRVHQLCCVSSTDFPSLTLTMVVSDGCTLQLLERHLKAGDAGIQSALEAYNKQRLGDVHALAYLDSIAQHVRYPTVDSTHGQRGDDLHEVWRVVSRHAVCTRSMTLSVSD